MINIFSEIFLNFSNITKLEKEQNLLLKSVESITDFNKRLQTVAKNANAAYIKKNEEIQKIQKELIPYAQTNSKSLNNYDESVYNYKSKFDAEVNYICY